MKFLKTSFLLFILLIFTSCEENTKTPITSDILSIKIQELNATIFSTDFIENLTATVEYEDGTNDDISSIVKWSSSDTSLLTVSDGAISVLSNGGEADIGISYESFSDSLKLTVCGLKSGTLLISSPDINTTGIHTLEARGDFINIDTNVTIDTNRTIVKNIVWSATNDAIITMADDIATININAGETNVTATVFDINVTKTYTIE